MNEFFVSQTWQNIEGWVVFIGLITFIISGLFFQKDDEEADREMYYLERKE